jgi:hypothetical protein
MEPHWQSPTSIEIPSYAKASEGYPPVVKSTEASSFEHTNNLAAFYASIHGQSPWSSAQVDKYLISRFISLSEQFDRLYSS